LQIEQNANVFSELFSRRPSREDALGVPLLRAMGGVEAKDIRAGLKQAVEHRGRIAGRPQRRHNFGIGHKRVMLTILTLWTSFK
jgi:hypothetical protein